MRCSPGRLTSRFMHQLVQSSSHTLSMARRYCFHRPTMTRWRKRTPRRRDPSLRVPVTAMTTVQPTFSMSWPLSLAQDVGGKLCAIIAKTVTKRSLSKLEPPEANYDDIAYVTRTRSKHMQITLNAVRIYGSAAYQGTTPGQQPALLTIPVGTYELDASTRT